MCYTARASLVAFVISVVIAIILWNRNEAFDRWNATFILSFAFIQLWEAGIWTSSTEKQTEFFLKCILVTLFIQPFVQTFFAYRYTNSIVLYFFVVVYTSLFLYSIYRIITESFYITIGPNGHLIWNSTRRSFMGGPIIVGLYLIGLILGLLWILPYSLPLIAVGLLTILFSLTVSTREFASVWCFSAIAYSIVALIIGVVV